MKQRSWLRFGGATALLAIVVSQAGCGTVVNLAWGVDSEDPAARPSVDTQVYGGVRNDLHGVGEAVRGEDGFWISLITFPFYAFIDLPVSLVADTLTLPYTIPYALSRRDEAPSKP
jgi:uncharacterized protein YceK